MTAPVVLQNQGIGADIQQGLAPLIQALQMRQQRQMQQQQLEVQQQQVQQQQASAKALERERVADRALALMEAIGPDVLEDESVAAMLEQGGVNPKGVLKKYQNKVKLAEDADKQFVASLPPEIAPGLDAAMRGVRAGVISRDDAFNFASEFNAMNVDPKVDEKIIAEFPEFADLPRGERIKQYTQMKILRAQARTGLGPEAQRQSSVQLAEARLSLTQLRTQLEKTKNPSQALQAAVALTRFVDGFFADPAQVALYRTPDGKTIDGMSRDRQIAAVFGQQALIAYRNALKVFARLTNAAVEQP